MKSRKEVPTHSDCAEFRLARTFGNIITKTECIDVNPFNIFLLGKRESLHEKNKNSLWLERILTRKITRRWIHTKKERERSSKSWLWLCNFVKKNSPKVIKKSILDFVDGVWAVAWEAKKFKSWRRRKVWLEIQCCFQLL